ncbi:MAG: 4-hydroxyphenylacetate 3-hydroxylase [Gammaproteobacteria bacterium]|nr:4-hydroxyphenylacetate 3-hydroxylase [Gammaproteobacteria bacterium]
MPARTGAQFLKGLQGDREVWLDGEQVTNVVEHTSLSGAAHALAEVYDLQHEHADCCLMPDPETGENINVSHLIPHSVEDLRQRHACLEKIAEYSVGLMGRTPDYLNVTYAGFAGRAEEWAINGNEQGAENLVDYQKKLRREDLSLTHTLVQPTIDKALGDAPHAGNTVALRKIGDTANGIIVSGARVLSTLAPFADELAVYPGHPLPEGADDYALSFCIPMSTPGLKFICRDSCSRPSNLFDYPLSHRFDEQDAFVIFDRVEIPRDRIHIDCNLEVYNFVMSQSWWQNIMQQTTVRALTKLEFAWGIATRMVDVINANQPPTLQMLGEIWSYVEMTRACLTAAVEGAKDAGNGVWLPDSRPFSAIRATMPGWMLRVNEIIRQVGSHNIFTTPSRGELDDPGLRPLIDHYLTGAGDVDAETRARVFRLGWDFAGSALAIRNEQYERFYLGSSSRNYVVAQTSADRTRAERLVDRFLQEEIS